MKNSVLDIAVTKVWFENGMICVHLNDGNDYRKPISLYPNLRKGTALQMEKYELWNNGKWIHWEELNEDLSAEGFLMK